MVQENLTFDDYGGDIENIYDQSASNINVRLKFKDFSLQTKYFIHTLLYVLYFNYHLRYYKNQNTL